MNKMIKNHAGFIMSRKTFIKGTVILTAAGILTRIMGFFFRIMLSRATGAEGMGMYQLVMPVLAVCTAAGISGFEVAVSRLCAYYTSRNDRNTAAVYSVLCFTGSIIICSVCTLFVYRYAGIIAIYILHNSACTPLIKTSILSLPFSCIHIIVCSHFIGRDKIWLPALSQLLEQAVRILSVYILIKIYIKSGEPCDASIGTAGLVIGEIFSAVLCAEVIICHKKSYVKYLLPSDNNALPDVSRGGKLFPYIREVHKTAFPVSVNRILLHLLQSVEAALIPMMLKIYGYGHSEAMSVYGIVTGMAMPIILFPSTLTNSVSTLLLPSISRVSDSYRALKKSGGSSLLFSLTFGFLCIIAFLTVGAPAGAYLFNEPSLSEYIRVLAWLCPLISITATFKSMLHALGQTALVLGNSMLSEAVNIVFIVVLVPRFGISAYLTGLLASQAVSAALCLAGFKRSISRIS